MRVPNQYENMISMTTLDYIEQKYRTTTLTELCEILHLPMHVLSKMIKKSTGFNFKELLQRKRLKQRAQPVKRDMIRIQVSDDLTLHTMASSLEVVHLASNAF